MWQLFMILMVAVVAASVLKVVLIGVAVALGLILIYGLYKAPLETIGFLLAMGLLSAFVAHPWIVLGLGAIFFLYVQKKQPKDTQALLPPLEADSPAETTEQSAPA